MKKFWISIIFLALISASPSLGNNASLFTYDAELIDRQLEQLNTLEAFLNANPGMTLSQMTCEGIDLAALTNAPFGISGMDVFYGRLLGIPGFCWGFFLGPIGVIIVAVISDDDNEKSKAMTGCIWSIVVSGVVSLVLTLSSI